VSLALEYKGIHRETPLGAEKRTNNKLNPHMTPGLGFEPGTHWLELSALTTVRSLLPFEFIKRVS